MFRSEDNESRWTLAPLGMRFRDYSHLENMWVACEFLNTISGNDDIVKKCTYPILWQGLMRSAEYKYHHHNINTITYLSTRDYDVLASIHNLYDAVRVHHCKVTRIEVPPSECLVGSFRIVKVLPQGNVM